jgi:hypothetical protein
MDPITLVFLIIAAVLFGLAAFSIAANRFNLVAAGLLAWVLSVLIPAIVH